MLDLWPSPVFKTLQKVVLFFTDKSTRSKKIIILIETVLITKGLLHYHMHVQWLVSVQVCLQSLWKVLKGLSPRYICILPPPPRHSIWTSTVCSQDLPEWNTAVFRHAVLILVRRFSFVILTASCQAHRGPGQLHVVRNTFVELSLCRNTDQTLSIYTVYLLQEITFRLPFVIKTLHSRYKSTYVCNIDHEAFWVCKKQDNVFSLVLSLIHLW